MSKILLFGATGHVGRATAQVLAQSGYELTIAVRYLGKVRGLEALNPRILRAEVFTPEVLAGFLQGQDVVISALGKNVSLNDRSKGSFRDIDYELNAAILHAAKQCGAKKFVYVSAFHAEKYPDLAYFKAHHDFSELLIRSGLDYSIVKPPAVFSAFLDLIEMAKKGRLMNIGKGDKKTNPIWEGDLAKVIEEAMDQPNAVIEAGGKQVLTRLQLIQIVQNAMDDRKKVHSVPAGLFKVLLPLIKIFDRNTYDKFAFFLEVMRHDTIAPRVGEKEFAAYVRESVISKS
jgi:uncharacterized protein YbjT (DUF2867 family)